MEASLQLLMQGLLRGWADKVGIREHVSTEAWHVFKCNCLDQVARAIAKYSQECHVPHDSPASRVLVDQLVMLVSFGILTNEDKALALQLYMQDLPLTLPFPPAVPLFYVSAVEHRSAVYTALAAHFCWGGGGGISFE